MNKIVVTDEEVIVNISECLKYEYIESFIPKIKIVFKKECSLNIIFKTIEKKYQIIYEVNNVNITIDEYKSYKSKNLSKYEISNSNVVIYKVNNCDEVRQNDIINLKNSNLRYVLKTVSTNLEKYNLEINHNLRSSSEIFMDGLNYSGTIDFNVSSSILDECCRIVNDINIINLTTKSCVIRPLLFKKVNGATSINSRVLNYENFLLDGNFENNNKKIIEEFLNKRIDSKNIKKLKKYWR